MERSEVNSRNLSDTLLQVRENISEVEVLAVSGASIEEQQIVKIRLARVHESISEINTTHF